MSTQKTSTPYSIKSHQVDRHQQRRVAIPFSLTPIIVTITFQEWHQCWQSQLGQLKSLLTSVLTFDAWGAPHFRCFWSIREFIEFRWNLFHCSWWRVPIFPDTIVGFLRMNQVGQNETKSSLLMIGQISPFSCKYTLCTIRSKVSNNHQLPSISPSIRKVEKENYKIS